ncbi:MAG TPA: ABC transporter permease [Gemmatimonadales bacterium]|nr:ABC transporter permease [Gemmatimonadales bacterium]
MTTASPELARREGSSVLASVAELVSRRDLLYMITWREIRIKYKQSVMGMLWAVLMPAVIVLAGVAVRFGFSRVTGAPLAARDVAAVAVKAVPWAFFVSTLRFATSSLIANTNLVTKIYLPREIFPVAATLSQLVDFSIASLVLAVLLAVLRVGVSPALLWLPLLILILVVLAMGLGILLSAASLFFRDVKYLVEVILTFAIFFTPVFYDAGMFGPWERILMLNPVAPLLEGIATVIVRHAAPPLAWVGYSGAVAVVTCVGALSVFRHLAPYFAESI